MEELFDKIDETKHVVIVIDSDASINNIAAANAFYSYLLQKDKKVSLYSRQERYDLNLMFLPWMDKVKSSYPTSSDLEVKSLCSLKLLEVFQKKDIKINQKMATSLYTGLLNVTQGFRVKIEGMVFAYAKVLVEMGADIKICNKYILNYQKLSTLRLKSILLNKMMLKSEASLAVFDLKDDDLKSSGAEIDECSAVLDEALALPSVKEAQIVYKNSVIKKRRKVE